MDLLKRKILEYGKVLPDNILKVDSFLNHQVDIGLLTEMGKEFAKLFAGCRITKVLTIEASGIILGGLAAQAIGVPMLFAKKSQTKNLSKGVYSAKVMSYTHGKVYDIFVSKEYLTPEDEVLIIDDFLANGEALRGLISLVEQAGAKLVGCGIAIEKGFQGGGDMMRMQGIKVESLAIIDRMSPDGLVFRS
ncbi:MAG TPA: xanthine phosphoribosyltransferase [Clostridia bacterium]|nr:xanthine phosphoribosyltransferase [Clostridia bacterium]